MSELTDLGIAGLRDGFRGGDFSAREAADAYVAAVAAAKPLNAFIIETPDHAIAAAETADRERATGLLRRSPACRWESRTCSAPPATRPPRQATCWRASPPPTNRP